MRTLYTLDSKNKVRIFEVEISINPLLNYAVITRTGLLSGKLIEKLELVKEGKQKRSIKEQAEFQANSLYQEKLDSGYKTILMYQQHSTKDIGDWLVEDILKEYPEGSITNSNWDELPMLAHKFKDVKKPEFPYFAQPKLNGVRMMARAFFNNTTDGIKLCSRGGQYYQVPHIETALLRLNIIIVAILKLDPTRVLLDGELYKHGVPLQEISGAARKETSGMFSSNDWLEYYIYDIINLDSKQDQASRLIDLQIIQQHFQSSIIKFVKTSLVDNQIQIKELHDEYISQGYEGLILRKPEGKYEFNQRSKNLLKVKEYQDAEFKIIGCGFDTNKSLGESFYFILQNDINSLTFKARPTGTSEQKVEWYNTQSWVNKKATVRYFERSNDGIPLQGSVQHKLSKVLIEHLRPQGE